MNKILNGSTLVAAIAALGMGAAQAETLRYADGGPNRGDRAKAVEYFMDTATEMSGGDLSFETHWAGALLKFPGMLSGVAHGASDLGPVLSIYEPQKLGFLALGDISQGYSDPWVGMRAMYELVTTNPVMKAEMDKLNLVYLSNFSSTGANLECRGEGPITSLSQLKGKRVRASTPYVPLLESLGAQTVNMTVDKIYQAFETGLIDCAVGYYYISSAYKFYEVVDAFVPLNWGQLTGFVLVMNKDTFAALPQEQQDALTGAGDKMIDHLAQMQLEGDKKTDASLRSGDLGKKIAYTELSERERASLLSLTDKLVADWVADNEAIGAEAIWEDYQELLVKYDGIRKETGYPWDR